MAPNIHKRIRKPSQKVKESESEDRKVSGRVNFSQEVRRILKEHYEENARSDKHLLRPERERLARKTGLTGEQVAQWYVNHRRRRGKVSNNNPPRSEAEARREDSKRGEKGQSSWPPKLNPEVHFPQPIPRHGCRCVPPVVPKSINFRDRRSVKRLLDSLIEVESDGLEVLANAVMLDNYVDKNIKRLEEKTVEDALMLVQNKAHMIWCT